MKTYILKLEAHDDVISTRDKMAWGKQARIVIVFPERGEILQRRLDLVLLQRCAKSLGAQLALVCDDPVVVENAGALSIPVFAKLDDAQRLSWRRGRSHQKSFEPGPSQIDKLNELKQRLPSRQSELEGNRWLRLVIFAVGVLSVLTVVALFIPTATIILPLAQQQQSLTLDISTSPNIPSANVSGGIPLHNLSVVVEQEGQMSSSSTLSVGDQTATGTIQLTNLTVQEVQVPVHTVITTQTDPAIRFETVGAADVPAGSEASVDVPIRALQSGTTGNVDIGAITAIQGELGLLVSVNNDAPTTGGTDKQIVTPSDADLEKLRGQVLDSLRQAALADLTSLAASDSELLSSTLTQDAILSEEDTPSPGDPADTLQVKMQVRYKAWAVSKTDLATVAKAALNANLPAGFAGADDTLQISDVSQPLESGTDTFQWEIRAERMIQAAWSRDTVIGATLGQDPKVEAALLKSLVDLRDDPQINLRPAWWARMPYLSFQVTVETR
jgi:hypothetical protein